MKKNLVSFLIFSLFSFAWANRALALDLYVSTTGDDAWSGLLPEANADSSDGPFATLERARTEIRNLSGPPSEGVTVFIRGGVYERNATFELTAADSGSASSPIIWRNFPGEEVFFRGGMSVPNFRAVTDTAVLARIDEANRPYIMQADLKALGMVSFPDITPAGPKIDFLFRGKSMPLCRFPNDEWTTIRSVLADDIITFSQSLTDRIAEWRDTESVWLLGYFYYDWSSSYQAVDHIEAQTQRIYLEPPLHHYGFRAGQRFYFLNILEELDAPGEWFLDRTSGVLYFWPPEPINEGDAYLSLLSETMLSLKNTANVAVRGLTFEGSIGGAIRIRGGHDNKIAGCTIRNILENAVFIDGKRNGIVGCDLYDLGAAGVILSGGYRMTLERGDNYADNNHIHHYARIQKTYHPAVSANSVGQIVTHNLVHDAPHQAFNWSGNEHLFEYNEIHDVALETGDVGAMYSGRDWTWRGTVIRYNYLHDIVGPGALGAMGVYLDDALSGTTIFGNIFYNTSRAAFIGGGRDNIVQNNIFLDNKVAVHIDDRGHGWASGYIAPGGSWHMYEKLNAVHYDEPPYSEYYPELASILDGDPALPEGNKIIANVQHGGKWTDFHQNSWGGIVYFENNVVLFYNSNQIVVEDGRVNVSDDFLNAHPFFQPIPVDSIGLYVSEDRPFLTGVKHSFNDPVPPEDFKLVNYPNPFNAATRIVYELEKNAFVELTAFDVVGRRVAVLVSNEQTAGRHEMTWEPNGLPSGVYLLRLQAGGEDIARRILLLK